MEQQSKIALITGGSRGLGKNMALALAEKGTDVIITYRSRKDEAFEVVSAIEANGRKAAAMQLDTSVVAGFKTFGNEVSALINEKWSRSQFDYLINNAGIDNRSLINDTTEDAFDSLMNVHFKGVYFLTQQLLPMIADNGGIVNLSTGLTRFTTPGYAAYASMKGAIETFTKYLAKEAGSRGIRANVVAPGIVKTDFTKAAREAFPDLEKIMSGNTALGRIGEPEDIGGVVAFLCSDDARWVNAQRIEASGGYSL
ncbi:MAG: SDR family oxidoreductase [Sphingobacteriales bacterium]|nr:MAG: SDR family oxidoreductase [Sphingobacteriales bacterium]